MGYYDILRPGRKRSELSKAEKELIKTKKPKDNLKGVIKKSGLAEAAAKRVEASEPKKSRGRLSRGLETAARAITANVGRVDPGQEWKAGLLKATAGLGLSEAARQRVEGDITAAERGLGAKKELATYRKGLERDPAVLEELRQKHRKELRDIDIANKEKMFKSGRSIGMTDTQMIDTLRKRRNEISKRPAVRWADPPIPVNEINFMAIHELNTEFIATGAKRKITPAAPRKKLRLE